MAFVLKVAFFSFVRFHEITKQNWREIIWSHFTRVFVAFRALQLNKLHFDDIAPTQIYRLTLFSTNQTSLKLIFRLLFLKFFSQMWKSFVVASTWIRRTENGAKGVWRCGWIRATWREHTHLMRLKWQKLQQQQLCRFIYVSEIDNSWKMLLRSLIKFDLM